MQMSAYRARAQEYATALGGAHHRYFAGLDQSWDPAAIHAAHADCWSVQAVEALGERAATGNVGARRLWRFAVTARLRALTAPHDDERSRRAASGGLPALTADLAVETDVLERARIEQRRLELTTETLSPSAGAALEVTRSETRRLGWPSYRALWTAMTGIDLGGLARRAEALLRDEDPPDLGDAYTRADVPRWHRAIWADQAFPSHALLPSLRSALVEHGTDPDDPGFTIDVAARPGKSSRAFCAAVRVPGDIHLVVGPTGGIQDAEALFHEAGHAVLLAGRDARWRFEERHLLPPHVAEAAAFAFERRVPDHGQERIAAHLATSRVLRRRRMAARLLHELDLLDHGPVQDLRERYARRMARATGLDWPGAPWLTDADALLGSADYVRADEIAG